jgi:hypothetical protein
MRRPNDVASLEQMGTGGTFPNNLHFSSSVPKLRHGTASASSSPLFPYPYPSPTRSSHNPFSKKLVPPTPPYFAMYMQINHLQRSVGDRYANKGLSGNSPSKLQSPLSLSWHFALPNLSPLLPLQSSEFLHQKDISPLFPLFPSPKSAL